MTIEPKSKHSSNTTTTKTNQSAVVTTTTTRTTTTTTCLADRTAHSSEDHDDDVHSLLAARALLDKRDPMFLQNQTGYGTDPIVLASHKLLFFDVPKIGSTEWKKLFRRMMGLSDWYEKEPHNPKTNGLQFLRDYSDEEKEDMMSSPLWTRAIFVRDPMERLLSAFLNKGFNGHIYYKCCGRGENLLFPTEHMSSNPTWKKQCEILFEKGRKVHNDMTPEDFPFENFVEAFMTQCGDPHWKPQSKRIHQQNWAFINFVGEFEHLADDAQCLLEKIGAWEEFGASGWGPDRTSAFLQKNNADHATGTSSKKKDLSAFFTSRETWEKVMEYLDQDYDFPFFNFTRPTLQF
jgi:Sulfotransferase family